MQRFVEEWKFCYWIFISFNKLFMNSVIQFDMHCLMSLMPIGPVLSQNLNHKFQSNIIKNKQCIFNWNNCENLMFLNNKQFFKTTQWTDILSVTAINYHFINLQLCWHIKVWLTEILKSQKSIYYSVNFLFRSNCVKFVFELILNTYSGLFSSGICSFQISFLSY